MKKCPSTISGETDPVELKTHLVQMTSSRFKKSFKSVQNQGLFVFNIKLLTPSGMYIDYNLRVLKANKNCAFILIHSAFFKRFQFYTFDVLGCLQSQLSLIWKT
ncbi:uncharacterized protein LOC105077222 isoform X2 [Camelus bactrianus]|uniref:Uncharacterized protein LOC105077222 isoform X2 n=1 Tax=Camelus bactrianus TaxID=9837 RepID=A0AC58QQ94_CAMBA